MKALLIPIPAGLEALDPAALLAYARQGIRLDALKLPADYQAAMCRVADAARAVTLQDKLSAESVLPLAIADNPEYAALVVQIAQAAKVDPVVVEDVLKAATDAANLVARSG